VFRRRRRDEANPEAVDGSEDEYLAADELPEDEDDYLEDDGEDDEAALGDPAQDEMPGFEGFADDEPGEDASAEGQPLPAAARPGRDDLSDPATWTRLRDSAVAEPANLRAAGPWDSGDDVPQAERVDLGCLLVPVRDGSDVQIGYSEETGVTIGVVSGDSMLQLQAFAAPRSSGLWSQVRPEIAEEVAKAGGRSQDQDGPFGPELLAWITPGEEVAPGLPPQPLRFLGVDGPRWFLRGLVTGPAAVDAAQARPLEEAFADVVVVRGDHAAPPRTPLEIHLPEQAAQLFEDQTAAQEQGLANPFERGPEITETR
jgi:hypothetical protein